MTEEELNLLLEFQETFRFVTHVENLQEVTIGKEGYPNFKAKSPGETKGISIYHDDQLLCTFRTRTNLVAEMLAIAKAWDEAGRPSKEEESFWQAHSV